MLSMGLPVREPPPPPPPKNHPPGAPEAAPPASQAVMSMLYLAHGTASSVLTDSSLCSGVHYGRGVIIPGGGAQDSEVGPSPP